MGHYDCKKISYLWCTNGVNDGGRCEMMGGGKGGEVTCSGTLRGCLRVNYREGEISMMDGDDGG